jgi:hypothetical protein
MHPICSIAREQVTIDRRGRYRLVGAVGISHELY